MAVKRKVWPNIESHRCICTLPSVKHDAVIIRQSTFSQDSFAQYYKVRAGQQVQGEVRCQAAAQQDKRPWSRCSCYEFFCSRILETKRVTETSQGRVRADLDLSVPWTASSQASCFLGSVLSGISVAIFQPLWLPAYSLK